MNYSKKLKPIKSPLLEEVIAAMHPVNLKQKRIINEAWKKRNPDKVRAYSHKYAENNRELLRQKGKEYRKKKKVKA